MSLQVITANRLIDGAVVYFTSANIWSTKFSNSAIFKDEQSATDGLKLAEVSVELNEVLDPYLIDVAQVSLSTMPVRYREIIRAKGPSTHFHNMHTARGTSAVPFADRKMANMVLPGTV